MSLQSIYKSLLVGLLAFHLSPRLEARDWAKDGWEAVSETDGIKVFRKSFPGTDMKGVAGETTVNASIGKILWIMVDHPHKPDWINRFLAAHTVEDIPPSSNIQYSAFDLPFPASDRDFVFRNDFSVDEKLGAVVIDVKSVADKREPEKEGFVRGQIIRGRYVLIPDGDKTIMQAEYQADPKGSIPVWLVNFFQKEWPYKTLDAMRNQLAKPYIKEWEVYTRVLKPKLEALKAAKSEVTAPSAISEPTTQAK
ncbi:MAG: hypothetical protein EOP07_20435 [Proteobacteria bacterium]|nr:MAG: hypothetical protein EOP07_20435 [Pseudomonadota bacterium]